MKQSRWFCLLVGALLSITQLRAEENKATHDELRALRDGMLGALNKADIEAMLPYMATNVVITWQSGEVTRGRDGLRTYYNRMMTGPDHIVQSFTTTVKVDELTILYGDSMGVAFGSSADHFVLKGGVDVVLPDRWTATVVKEAGAWRVAALQISANVFDNPLLSANHVTMTLAILAALIGGLIGGWVIGKRRKT